MKVTAFIGSARKKHTYHAAEQFLQTLQSLGNIAYEIVPLREYNLQTCQGCKLCFDKGEEYCPFHDDRDILIEKMITSDGVIFASPNYAFHVSAIMKIFLDRLGFVLHRPCCFGKAFTSIVAQGIYGGKDIVKYFNFIGQGLGFNVVNGCCITTLEPMTEKGQKNIETIIDKQSKKFYTQFIKNEYPTPSVFKLMMFRMSRSSMKIMLNENFRDYTYYRNNGWFESDYYYPVKLRPLKKLTGTFFDMLAIHLARNH
ncbi:flavin reductase [Candidatus Vecturithrix granuli]|uniref:Flavin reductase n=1 Tax=Vecturithrix granuli TaxID=1499967 RepID=A0A081C1Z2_VECG1|nr:flavin reductase [Candidatus Vecturithrix granuli]